MKLAVLFSGGKDSVFSLYKTLKQGNEVRYLVTIFPERQDSWMFHRPCIELTKLLAESLGIKQIVQNTKGEKEKELDDLKKVLAGIKNDIEGVVSGAVASNYQKNRIDKICKELELESIAPLWREDSETLLKEEIKLGFEIIVTGVFADGFDKNWLGRRIDEKCVEDLKELNKNFGINISGEGGEYESLVLSGPIFKKKIRILDCEIIWENNTNSGYLVVKKAELSDK